MDQDYFTVLMVGVVVMLTFGTPIGIVLILLLGGS
jgi:hypothetical protein